jgi:HEAT repeat protein
MLKAKTVALMLIVGILSINACFAQTLEKNWNDYLHYTLIGRLDMAKAHAQAIIDGDPNSEQLLALSEDNPNSYSLLQRAKATPHDKELAQLSEKLWDIIEEGRNIRRTKAKVIVTEIERLSKGNRAYRAGLQRLKKSGEYAIPFMIDALSDMSRQSEWTAIKSAMPEIGKDAIRPLAAALQTKNVSLKTDIINSLGKIRYPQALAYLKYVVEKDPSMQIRTVAQENISKINAAAMNNSAAELFYRLAEAYYYHNESLTPLNVDVFANVWFWDAEAKKLTSEKVHYAYFYEMMAMRACEWALKADPTFDRAIGLWVAAYFKAESTNNKVPNYFGHTHADALTYATTAGPQYLHQALARAVEDKNAYVSLGVVEALAVNAGEASLFYRLGTKQPLVQALTFNDRAVRYSAAIAIAGAGPLQTFPERNIVISNLAEALTQPADKAIEDTGLWNQQVAASYVLRSVSALLKVAQSRNPVLDLSVAQDALIGALKSGRPEVEVMASQVLAHINSPQAQTAVAQMALDQARTLDIRVAAFASLAVSGKINTSLLDSTTIDAIYAVIASEQQPAQLRSAAAAAYGALNLPSQRVKELILDQSKS